MFKKFPGKGLNTTDPKNIQHYPINHCIPRFGITQDPTIAFDRCPLWQFEFRVNRLAFLAEKADG